MVVFDASALIAIALDERGHHVALPYLSNASILTVNASEFISGMINRGANADDALASFRMLDLHTVPLSEPVALEAGRMRAETRHLGLSLGDRCCLALAKSLGVPAITSDRAWADLDLGVEIVLIR